MEEGFALAGGAGLEMLGGAGCAGKCCETTEDGCLGSEPETTREPRREDGAGLHHALQLNGFSLEGGLRRGFLPRRGERLIYP